MSDPPRSPPLAFSFSSASSTSSESSSPSSSRTRPISAPSASAPFAFAPASVFPASSNSSSSLPLRSRPHSYSHPHSHARSFSYSHPPHPSYFSNPAPTPLSLHSSSPYPSSHSSSHPSSHLSSHQYPPAQPPQLLSSAYFPARPTPESHAAPALTAGHPSSSGHTPSTSSTSSTTSTKVQPDISDAHHQHFHNTQSANMPKRPQKTQQTPELKSSTAKEEVWPADVEDAFMEALEEIPRLGRTKRMLNGKQCGRNELLAAFVMKKTGQYRTRKQVSSHIQVLKNTRKDDTRLMNLLLYGGSGTGRDCLGLDFRQKDSRQPKEGSPTGSSASPPPSSLQPPHSSSSMSSSISSQEALTPYSGGHSRQASHHRQLSIASILNPDEEGHGGDMAREDQGRYERTMDAAPEGRAPSSRDGREMGDQPMSMYGSHPSLHEPPRSMPAMRSTPDAGRRPTPQDYDPWTSYENEGYSFWPCQYRLTQARGPQETVLAEDEVPFHDELGSRSLGSVRFPSLLRGFGTRSCLRLLVKMNLKINRIAGDMVLMTQNLFQSNQRHTVRCITTAYSFGEKTMQMSEVQHASFSGNRYVYSFTLANDWLKSFLQSLREGVGSAEIQSLKNITIIQEFSVDDSPDSQSAPQSLLQVMYEFGVGDGELETYKLSTDSPAMDTPMMLAPTITTTNASLTTPSSVTGHTRARASTWDSSGPYRFRNGVDYGSSSPSLWGGDTHLHPPHEHSSSRPHHPSQYPPPSYERHSQHLYPPSQQHQQPRHQYQRHHRGIGGSVHGSFSQYGTSLPLPPNLGMKRSSVEGGRDEDVYYPLPDRTKDKRVCTTYARPSPAPLYQ